MTPSSKIYVAGHNGMVGSATLRRLHSLGYTNTLTANSKELDLTRQKETEDFLQTHRPDVIVMTAAKVGGIHANYTYPADFCYQNLAIASNTIHAAYQSGVSRFLFLGSSCIYPKLAPQPLKEDALLSSTLEPTNEAYAIAKIAGLKLCEYYRQQYGVLYHSLMPTNLYGPGDNYHPDNSHLLPALINRFHEAKKNNAPEVTIWGTGTPLRELMHADDLADATVFALQLHTPPSILNAGTGKEHSIRQIAELVAQTVGYEGKILNDISKPDGTPRKLMDITALKKLGWTAQIPLKRGIKSTYKSYLKESAKQTLKRS